MGDNLQQKIEDFINQLDEDLSVEDRVAEIKKALYKLNFEFRLSSLSENQLHHMADESLCEGDRQRLEKATTEAEKRNIYMDASRTLYFRQCTWIQYLNGETDEPPVPSQYPAQKSDEEETS
jgi:hypothetical protein